MPANIKGKKKKYGKSGMVSYKKGGALKPVYNANGVKVPGMFQGGREVDERFLEALEDRARREKKKEKGNPFN